MRFHLVFPIPPKVLKNIQTTNIETPAIKCKHDITHLRHMFFCKVAQLMTPLLSLLLVFLALARCRSFVIGSTPMTPGTCCKWMISFGTNDPLGFELWLLYQTIRPLLLDLTNMYRVQS